MNPHMSQPTPSNGPATQASSARRSCSFPQRAARLALGVIPLGLLVGCTAHDSFPDDRADYVLIYLKSGPNSGAGTKDERSKMFAGHMANIHRLASEKKLLIAGPFDKPSDSALRGLFVLDVPTIAEALSLANTDPGVQAGEFVADAHRMRATDRLRTTPELERAMLERTKDIPTDPTTPPTDLKKYVLLQTDDVERTHASLAHAGWNDRVVWHATFDHEPARPDNHDDHRRSKPGGVLVLDARQPSDVLAALGNAGDGQTSAEGWWSTASLVGLMSPASPK